MLTIVVDLGGWTGLGGDEKVERREKQKSTKCALWVTGTSHMTR